MRRFFAGIVLCLMAAPALAVGPGWDEEAPPPDDLAGALRLIEAERWADAAARLEALSARRPDDPEVWNLLGFSYRKGGDLDRAGPAYERALTLDPDHLGALAYQGELFLQRGDEAAALVNLARLTALCPQGCAERDALAAALGGAPLDGGY